MGRDRTWRSSWLFRDGDVASMSINPRSKRTGNVVSFFVLTHLRTQNRGRLLLEFLYGAASSCASWARTNA